MEKRYATRLVRSAIDNALDNMWEAVSEASDVWSNNKTSCSRCKRSHHTAYWDGAMFAVEMLKNGIAASDEFVDLLVDTVLSAEPPDKRNSTDKIKRNDV